MSGFLEIIGSIFSEIFSITVPGFENVTFFQLLATLFLLSVGVSIIRFLLGLPMGITKDALREEFRNDITGRRNSFRNRGNK